MRDPYVVADEEGYDALSDNQGQIVLYTGIYDIDELSIEEMKEEGEDIEEIDIYSEMEFDK